jgi:hypothetical protein
LDPQLVIREARRQWLAALAPRMPVDQATPFRVIARRRLKIRTADSRVIDFRLRTIQKRYLARQRLARQRGKRPRFLLLKYRRGGFTTLEQARSYVMVTGRRNINCLTLAQDGDVTQRIFRIARLMHERDPQAPAIKGPGNQYRLEFPGLNSIFYLSSAQARSFSRGDTLSRVHWSEVAWCVPGYNQTAKQREVLTGLSEACEHGEMVLETTPNGSELFRDLYVEAKRGGNDWTPIFLPWFSDTNNRMPCEPDEAAHIAETLDEEEDRLVRAHGLSPEQIKWRRAKKRELKHLFYQEYPEDDETCWLIAGVPFFNAQLLMTLRDFCTEPELVEGDRIQRPPNSRQVQGGWYVEWEQPVLGEEYVIGADTSEGLPGSDPNGFGVMQRSNGVQVAAAHGLFSIRDLAEQIVKAHHRWNGALTGIERNNHGHAVIQKVQDLGLADPHTKGGGLYCFSGDRPGWDTNAVTRPIMLEGLRDWLETPEAEARIRDRYFLNECLTFRKQANGGFEHDPGCHDDSVIKWAIANQMRTVDVHTAGIYEF